MSQPFQWPAIARLIGVARRCAPGLAILAAIAIPGRGGADGPTAASGFDVSGMDRSVAPGTDFFRYANGAWERRTAIPADRSSIGTIGQLDDLSRTRVHAILDELARDRASRAGTAYRAFRDQDRIDRLGMASANAWLARLRAARSPDDYWAAAARAGRRGVDLPLAFAVEPDDRDPGHYALTVSQGVLGMPDRDYYTSDIPAMRQARAAYRDYLIRMLKVAGVAGPDSTADAVFRLETAIAASQWSAADSRDAARTYNPVAVSSLDAGRSRYRVAALVRALGYRTARIIVRQPDAVARTLRLIDAAPVATMRAMLIVRTLHRYAEVLPAEPRGADFAFYGHVIDGVDTPEPRWRRAIAFVLDAVPDEVSKLYVARHFAPATRTAAEAMVGNLVAAFNRRIDALDWMTPETKVRAHRKLAAFHAQIGYPDRWHVYAGLTMRDGDAFGNAMRAAEFRHDWEAAKIGRAIYRWEWSATPMTVDAFANYPKVAITFPAAILQPPFFDPAVDPAVNYGGIGASIAHEMTHQFDDQGAKYDEQGRLASWWSAADRTAFAKRTAVLAAQFDKYEPLPALHVNGALTLGENIADLGGLTIAYNAYRASLGGREAPVIAGLTGDQRFFLGWAQIWRLKYRDADLRRRLLTNPHAPAAQRVWTARNLEAWVRAFGVSAADPLYLAPVDRAAIW
ncbi:M13 family metallopeptidase [Sphingomonas asaccharolytica]|uniref:M13 family metallopeptidase n=1 Tax=Sphingomonas asaccharolytica TaxID=40681 RepID=UPI000A0736D9|nr:M13 family metallopeptidase [Sphingomonas asaccharolytica]